MTPGVTLCCRSCLGGRRQNASVAEHHGLAFDKVIQAAAISRWMFTWVGPVIVFSWVRRSSIAEVKKVLLSCFDAPVVRRRERVRNATFDFRQA